MLIFQIIWLKAEWQEVIKLLNAMLRELSFKKKVFLRLNQEKYGLMILYKDLM